MAVIIFKPIEKCNSNCLYCDVVNRKDQSAIMSLDLLETVFQRIAEYLTANPEKDIELIWHGGEPLLLGKAYFERAYELQEKYCLNVKNRLRHSIQSNLTLLTQAHLDVLKKLGISGFGSSFEPIEHVRGPGEDRDSMAYNKLFLNSVRLLEENNFSYGLIYVVHKGALGRAREIFHFLFNLNLRGALMFNPVLIYDNDDHHLAITPEEYADFLGEVFAEYWPNRKRYGEVSPFSALIKSAKGEFSLPCGDAGSCYNGWLYIGPQGQTSQCGRAGDFAMLNYGSIENQTLGEVLNNSQRDQLRVRNESLPHGDCAGCRLWGVCHGGCPLDSFNAHKDFSHKTDWCISKKQFIEKYFEPITGLKIDQPHCAPKNEETAQ